MPQRSHLPCRPPRRTRWPRRPGGFPMYPTRTRRGRIPRLPPPLRPDTRAPKSAPRRRTQRGGVSTRPCMPPDAHPVTQAVRVQPPAPVRMSGRCTTWKFEVIDGGRTAGGGRAGRSSRTRKKREGGSTARPRHNVRAPPQGWVVGWRRALVRERENVPIDRNRREPVRCRLGGLNCLPTPAGRRTRRG